MGRRLVGGALVALGLIAASLAWVGFSASRTALDPGRSQAIADDLYRDREVRAQMRSSLADTLGGALPEGVQVSRSELVAAADAALDDPAVEALLVGGLIRAHQRFLGADPNPDEPIIIDGAAIAVAARNSLVNLRPELITVVPVPPSVPVELPTDQLPNAGGFRRWLNGAVALMAAVSVGLIVAAFVLTNERARVLRRVGFWAIGASLFWIVIGFVLPELAHLLIPGPSAILAAMWGVASGGMFNPSRTAFIAGVAAVIVSYLWTGVAALFGGRSRAQRPARQPAGVQSAAMPRPVQPQPVPARPSAGSYAPVQPVQPVRTPGPVTPPRGTPVVPAAVAPVAPPQPTGPRWVEGVGYVDDDDRTLPG